MLADILIAYLETELCLLTRYGLPIIPSHEETMSSTKPFSALVDIPFPLDTLDLVDPEEPPIGWKSSFDTVSLGKIALESRHFALSSSPYAIPPVGFFVPLRDVVDPAKSDPSSARHVWGLPQPKMFCADANDHEQPMSPTSHEGWDPFIWNSEKHYWVSSTPGARIRVEIIVTAGR